LSHIGVLSFKYLLSLNWQSQASLVCSPLIDIRQ